MAGSPDTAGTEASVEDMSSGVIVPQGCGPQRDRLRLDGLQIIPTRDVVR